MSEFSYFSREVPEPKIGTQAEFDEFMRKGMNHKGRAEDQILFQKYGAPKEGLFAEEIRTMDMDPAMRLVKETDDDRRERHERGAQQESDLERYKSFLEHQIEMRRVGETVLNEMLNGTDKNESESEVPVMPEVREAASIAAPTARDVIERPH